MNILYFIYLFTYQQTSRLLPPFGYCEKWCHEYGHTNICVPAFCYFGYTLRREIPGYGINNSIFNPSGFFGTGDNIFQSAAPLYTLPENGRLSQCSFNFIKPRY